MSAKELYQIRSAPNLPRPITDPRPNVCPTTFPQGVQHQTFRCVKFDKDFNYTGEYHIVERPSADGKMKILDCSCYAGHKECRHKKMLDTFRIHNKINQPVYYSFDKDKWYTPPTATED